MTKAEAIARFHTVTSAEEMADLMLECLRTLGHDETEIILTEILEGGPSIWPYHKN